MTRKPLLHVLVLVACILCSLNASAALEAYAFYTRSDSTLTFYYDKDRIEHAGITPGIDYDLNTGSDYPDWNNSYKVEVAHVEFNSTFASYRPTTTYRWFEGMTNLKSINGINNLNTSQVTNMQYMFSNCTSLTNLDLSGFNTANLRATDFMFNGCQNLATIIVGDSWSNAGILSSVNMFKDCFTLKGDMGTSYNANYVGKTYAHIDGGPSNPGYLSRVREAYACYTSSNHVLTFYYDDLRSTRTGTTYDLNTGSNYPDWYSDGTYGYVQWVVFDPSFAGARPTTTSAWFLWMSDLQSILGMEENLNTSQVTDMSSMFLGCDALTSLDLSNFNTSKVKDMRGMFQLCSNLRSLDLSSFNTSQVTNMQAMFYSCSSLSSLDMSHFDTSKVTSMNQMLEHCSGLSSLDLGSFNTAKVTNMGFMFDDCTNLTTICVGSGWSTAAVTSSMNMFQNCTSIMGGAGTTYDPNHVDKAYAHVDGGPSNPGYFTSSPEPYSCYTSSNQALTFYYDNLRSTRTGTTYDLNKEDRFPDWYYDNTNQSVIWVVFDPSFADARPVTTRGWFSDMENAYTISTLYYLNTSEVEDMAYMFAHCRGMNSINVSHFDTHKVKEMNGMFWDCAEVVQLDLRSFNTAQVTRMDNMFADCSLLRFLNVSSFNTSQVTNMSAMFDGCSNLEELYLSNFNTSQVTNMALMFMSCHNLTSLDLSSFNTAKVTNMNSMFIYASQLKTIYVGSGWSNESVTQSDNMFYWCASLVGGKGTTYNSNNDHTVTYAHIDGGPDNPGYFTDINPHPYAVFTPENTTLTFYYDNLRGTRPGTSYDMNSENNNTDWVTDGNNANVTHVVFDSSFENFRPTTTYAWFYGMQNLESITGMNYLNTSDVTNMDWMFADCQSLTSLDLSNFSTNNVERMVGMFSCCPNLTSLDLSSFNTTNVFNMESMFIMSTGLTSLDLSSFNTSKVSTMKGMFSYCTGLTSLDLSGFNTAQVYNMESMFYDCLGLTELDLSSFNTGNVTTMLTMFKDCSNLTTIIVGNDWNLQSVTRSNEMFQGCESLVGDMGTTYDSNHTNADYAHIDGGSEDPGYLTRWREAYAVYTQSNTTLTFYCDHLRASRSGISYDLPSGDDFPGWYGNNAVRTSTTQVVFDELFVRARPTTTYDWFLGMTNLQSITGLPRLNTSRVTNMSNMFGYCINLASLDLSNFNTAQVTDMSYMFYDCSSLTSLDLSSFNTAQVTDMSYMFDYCSSLSSLDVSSFNTSYVTNMEFMFHSCPALTSLDLSSFNIDNVKTMYQMFRLCSNLTTIYVDSEWNTDSVVTSHYMFLDCPNLVGGKGTVYDANHVDKAYAHIDGGSSYPGYLTDLNEAYVVYTPENTTLTFYYDNMRASREGVSYDLNETNSNPDWYTDNTCGSVVQVVFDSSFAKARPISTLHWFGEMGSLVSIIGIEHLNTSRVTTMSGMFRGCTSLTSLDLSSFNTSQVTNMGSMFRGCTNLKNLNMSGWNTESLTSPGGMFMSCKSLTSLDLYSWNTANVTSMGSMFRSCTNLTTIYVGSGWSTESLYNGSAMFMGCTSLVGGQGTTFNDSHTNEAYAHIDGGPSNPGYLTEGPAPAFTPGDVNNDGNINISDVTSLINYLLSNDASNISLQGADCNADGSVTISDVTRLINYLLTKEW